MAKSKISQTCSISGCHGVHAARSYCNKHYKRLLEHGDPHYQWVRSKPKQPCSIEGCRGTRIARGLCAKHWYRWRRYGDTAVVSVIVGDSVARFWSKVQKTTSCWLWIGRTVSGRGYGQLTLDGKTVYAHRYSFYLAHGRWPFPMCLHSCPNGDNPRCVNPAHLREGSSDENMWDRNNRNRTAKGEDMAASKLTETQVLEIRQRALAGESPTHLARVFGVNVSTVYRIKSRKAWRHI